MKKENKTVPAPSKLNVLRQICNFIPDFLVPKLARETGVEKKVRTFSAWSHVVSLLYAQLTHSIGLNDVCDALSLHSGPLSSLRGATPPSRNNLSNSNKVRSAEMAERLFWAVLEHLGNLSPRFISGKAGKRFARRFKRTIHVVDSTTIPLIASCMDWARHRRRKAAAKCHLRLDLQSFLPRFAIVDTARHADAKRAREVCAGIKAGEIVIFDKAYVDFDHLADLTLRLVFWVTRAKDNLSYKVNRCLQRRPQGKILRDELIVLKSAASRQTYPDQLRRIVALVEVDGREVEMVFLSNNLEWSAQSILELYRCRWEIEVFFKQIKQTLQLADFLGTSANAVRWQIWTALLAYLLLRYVSFLSNWSHSFSRLFTLIRTGLWKKWDLLSFLNLYGTANGHFRYIASPEQAYLPGLG
jgi:IS4 transposase